MQFDQAAIHDLAAEMFWRMAEDVGVQQVIGLPLETRGRCLLEHRFDSDLWQVYGLTEMPRDVGMEALEAVAAEAYAFTQRGENMLGRVFLEDRETGRSPSASAIDTSALNIVPHCTYSQPVERLGQLCLRHPLPAIVFADRPPAQSLIEVADTSAALGFDMPMLLLLAGAQEIAPGAVMLAGYFHIPVPNEAQGDLWASVIQNSNCVITSAEFVGPDGNIEIDYSWRN